MRPIRDILKELRSRPLRYWLGWDEPLEYEVEKGRVFMVSASGRREVLVLGNVERWRKSEKSVCVYQRDCTRIIGDSSDKLGSILEREIPERWTLDAEDE